MSDVPHPSEFIAEELIARHWSVDDLAWAMCDGTARDAGICRLAIDIYDSVGPDEPKMFMGEVTATQLSKALGVSAEYFLALEDSWRQSLTKGENA